LFIFGGIFENIVQIQGEMQKILIFPKFEIPHLKKKIKKKTPTVNEYIFLNDSNNSNLKPINSFNIKLIF
jgi:hypothetical protein